jgi:very-short-patch-repair endonuclease
MGNNMSKSKYFDFNVIKKHARELRNCMTDSEKLLWEQLRNRKLSGYKFLRQHPIVYKADYKGLNYFIADFYCNEKKAVIELDGMIHQDTQEYDEFRDIEMKELGINVLRIKNEDLENIDEVLQKINNFLDLII